MTKLHSLGKDGDMIKKILINTLTLIRIPLTILFIILFINNNITLELLVLFLILLTDFIDGKLSRKLNASSKFGGILDVYCDLFFVLCTSILFNVYNLVNIAYTIILVFKFIEFNITSYYAGASKNNIPFVFDKIGKSVTALYQTVPFFIIFPPLSKYSSLYIVCLMTGTIISSILRIFSLVTLKKVID